MGLGRIHNLFERILCTSRLRFVDQHIYYTTLIKLVKAVCVLKFAFFRVSLPPIFRFSPYNSNLAGFYSFYKVQWSKSYQTSTKHASIPKGYLADSYKKAKTSLKSSG